MSLQAEKYQNGKDNCRIKWKRAWIASYPCRSLLRYFYRLLPYMLSEPLEKTSTFIANFLSDTDFHLRSLTNGIQVGKGFGPSQAAPLSCRLLSRKIDGRFLSSIPIGLQQPDMAWLWRDWASSCWRKGETGCQCHSLLMVMGSVGTCPVWSGKGTGNVPMPRLLQTYSFVMSMTSSLHRR